MADLWSETFQKIKEKHDAAFTTIEKGIASEEKGDKDLALEDYKQGIRLIDEALAVQVSCPEHPDFSWEKARVMVQKMKKTRAEVLMRIAALNPVTETETSHDGPPSYEEATSPSTLRTYGDLAKALRKLQIEENRNLEAELIYIYEGVSLYFISPNGDVSSASEPQTMKIVMLEDENDTHRALLLIGDWVYPLIPGVSPCYRSNFGAFILPNVYAEQPGASIGLILPPDTDADVYELLESILYGIVGRYEPKVAPSPAEDISVKISSGIVHGADFLSQCLMKGAEKIGDAINYTTPKIIETIGRNETPKPVPQNVAKGMEIAENTTNKAAQFTGYIANQIGVATNKLGSFLAPHIQKQGTRLLRSSFKLSEEDASKKVKGVLTVAAGAVEGVSTVYHGLENSASILGNNLKNNTVKLVEHKYGGPAGNLTDSTFNTVGNVIHITKNTKIIRPKHFIKHTAKAAGKAVVYEYRSSQPNVNVNSPSCSSSSSTVIITEINEPNAIVPSEKK